MACGVVCQLRIRVHHVEQLALAPLFLMKSQMLPAWKYETITCDGYSG